jgi:hypothetical protein
MLYCRLRIFRRVQSQLFENFKPCIYLFLSRLKSSNMSCPVQTKHPTSGLESLQKFPHEIQSPLLNIFPLRDMSSVCSRARTSQAVKIRLSAPSAQHITQSAPPRGAFTLIDPAVCTRTPLRPAASEDEAENQPVQSQVSLKIGRFLLVSSCYYYIVQYKS